MTGPVTRKDLMIVNMGPHHPSMHGVFVSSFRGAHSKTICIIAQQKIRALFSAHRDRDKKKRDFRRLWITRINAAIRETAYLGVEHLSVRTEFLVMGN